jgi:hypothetical protein
MVQPKAAMQPIAVLLARFSHIHLDLVGPLPASAEGFSHLLTVIDRSSCWCEALPLRSTTAEACAAALVAGWVARFGVPAIITSDRGPQFSSAVWAAFTTKLGILHTMATAYHPHSNGMVERLHCPLKEALKARLAAANWPEHLPWVLLGIRAAPREDSGISAAEMVYGPPLCLPGIIVATQEQPPEAYRQQFQAGVSAFTPSRVPQHQQTPTNSQLQQAQFVYIRTPPAAPALSPAYRGPYRVIQPGAKVFRVMIGGREDKVSTDRLKPHLGPPPEPASPPPRGRPPNSVSSSAGSQN